MKRKRKVNLLSVSKPSINCKEIIIILFPSTVILTILSKKILITCKLSDVPPYFVLFISVGNKTIEILLNIFFTPQFISIDETNFKK